jgi:hypothetical protein
MRLRALRAAFPGWTIWWDEEGWHARALLGRREDDADGPQEQTSHLLRIALAEEELLARTGARYGR